MEGGNYINVKIQNEIKQIIGDEAWNKFAITQEYLELLSEIELLKCVSTKYEDQTIEVRDFVEFLEENDQSAHKKLLDNKKLPISKKAKKYFLNVNTNTLKEWFEGNFKAISNKIKDMIREINISCIVFRGGFSESILLKNHMTQNLNAAELFFGESASVLIGALQMCSLRYTKIELPVVNTIRDVSYGIRTCIPYDRTIHKEEDMRNYGGVEYFCFHFYTMMEANESYDYNHSVTHKFTVLLAGQTSLAFELFAFKGPSPKNTHAAKQLATITCTVPLLESHNTEKKKLKRGATVTLLFGEQIKMHVVNEEGAEATHFVNYFDNL